MPCIAAFYRSKPSFTVCSYTSPYPRYTRTALSSARNAPSRALNNSRPLATDTASLHFSLTRKYCLTSSNAAHNLAADLND